MKRKWTLHVNMLWKWHTLAKSAYWAKDVADELDTMRYPHGMGGLSTQRERRQWENSWYQAERELQQLLDDYHDVVRDSPS